MESTPPQSYQPNPEVLLQQEIHYRLAQTLRDGLPPLADDTPEARDRQIRCAIADAAALVPSNSFEAHLAAQAVATAAHQMQCLSQVRLTLDPKRADQIRAQAAHMGREQRGFINALLRLQRVREKRESTEASCGNADRTEHSVRGLMLDAVPLLPPMREVDADAIASAAASAAGAAASAGATPAGQRPKFIPRDYDDWSDEEKAADRLRWEGDRYAILNTDRVKLMRKIGGLPPGYDFEVPRPDLLEQILHGDSANLRWADTYEKPKREG